MGRDFLRINNRTTFGKATKKYELPQARANKNEYSVVATSGAVTMIILIALVAVPLFNKEPPTYKLATATGPEPIIALRFVSEARPEDVAAFLDAFHATVVEAPRPGGFYRLRVGAI